MEISPPRRDQGYRYPSLEDGIDFCLSSSRQCQYLEILHFKAGDGKLHTRCVEGELGGEDVAEWIKKDPTKLPEGENTKSRKLTGGLRVLMGSCTLDGKYRLLPFQKQTFETITHHLSLPEQFLSLMEETAGGSGCAIKFSRLQPRDEAASMSVFTPDTCYVCKFRIFCCYYYHIALSYNKKTKVTHALVLTKTTDHNFSSITESLKRKSKLACHLMLLPTLIAEICVKSSSNRIIEQDRKLNELEEIMGQHEWSNRPVGDPLGIDFTGATRRLYSVSRALGLERTRVESMLLNLGEMWKITRESSDMKDVNGEGEGDEYMNDEVRGSVKVKSESDGERVIEELVKYHINTCKNMALRIDWEERRAQTQISVVFQFMAQKDAKVNIQLATTSTLIARETKKDGSSMKTIAVLTMCFLPGTFLAALFAMPLFNWDNDELPITKEGFKYYWAIAIPLTALVMLVWALAMFVPWKGLIVKLQVPEMARDIEGTAFGDK